MLCDLHIHSCLATGSQTPEAIIEEAVSKGIRLVPITDDDTMHAYRKLPKIAARHEVAFITGLQVSGSPETHRGLSREHKKAIGADIKTVQFGWPLGMPLVEQLMPGLWEVRSDIPDGIARVFFTVDRQTMVLLHGFIKKSNKIPARELRTAKARLRQYREAK